MGMHLWQVVGRHVPTERNPKPKIFRMKVFAEDEVRARSLVARQRADQLKNGRDHHSFFFKIGSGSPGQRKRENPISSGGGQSYLTK